VTLRYVASGSNDDSFVKAYALAASPAIVAGATGILYRQDLSIEPQGFECFHIDVPYAEKKAESGKMRISFDTQGGSIHITQAKAHIARFPGTAPDYKGAIGVTGKDDVEGADIVIPALKLTVGFTHPLGVITLTQIFNMADWTGQTNSDVFLGRQPGEILYLGSTGSEGSESPADVDHHFAYSKNLTGLTIGGISGVSKKGHEYYWIRYKPAVDGGKSARQPEAIYVERLYDTFPMAMSFGFGG
jgi:hypothetical protein